MNARERESKIVSSIVALVRGCEEQTTSIRNQWQANHQMFVEGSVFEGKEPWQTTFSINKFQTAIRVAQGELVNTLVQVPDWYKLVPRSENNPRAEKLASTLQTLMDYYLNAAKFKRHAGTFFFDSLLAMGSQHVGWKARLIQNPEYVAEKTRKLFDEEQKRLSRNVANPRVNDTSSDDLERDLMASLDGMLAEMFDEPAPKPKIPPYIQVGCLDIGDVIPENAYWEPNVSYLEDSPWKAFRYTMPKYELNRLAKLGYFQKSKVKKLAASPTTDAMQTSKDRRWKNIMRTKEQNDLVHLLVYYGPLIIDDEVERDQYFCVIGNDSTILKDGECPYWLPPGQSTPIINAAVRTIPHRATGAGIGDSAYKLQRTLDSNWQLITDSFRKTVSPIQIIDQSALVDKSVLDEGLKPGMVIEVRGDPEKVFKNIDLSTNLEQHVSAVQGVIENAIEEQTGINDLFLGGNNPYSRTSAAETNARIDGSRRQVNIIALDLEENYIKPFLQQALARILQFGIAEINSNPELASLLDEEQKMELAALSETDRMSILNYWYAVDIKGFSDVTDRNEQAMRLSEILQLANSGGPVAQVVKISEVISEWAEAVGIKNRDRLLITEMGPLQKIEAENALLAQNQQIMPGQQDNHEMEVQAHSALPMELQTPALQEHIMLHQQFMQQMMMVQQQQQAGMPQGRDPSQVQ